MSARDVIYQHLYNMVGLWEPDSQADACLAALHAMPHPDRLALARELAGPEWAVVPRQPSVEMLQAGHDAYRATHLGGLSGMTIDAQIRAQCCREAACWTAMLTTSEKETP